jgi:hypothetical protein
LDDMGGIPTPFFASPLKKDLIGIGNDKNYN